MVFLFSLKMISKTDLCFDARFRRDTGHSYVRRES
jgi:hypothetical protein